jgi:glycerate 2-kinase
MGAPPLIRNIEELLSRGLIGPRRLALEVATAGLRACDPGLAVERRVRFDYGELVIDGRRHRLDPSARLVVLGSGKASLRIAIALERVLGKRLEGGVVAVRDAPPAMMTERIEVVEAGHPLPDRRSFVAAQDLLDLGAGLVEGDMAIACFTGGSSALTSLPPDGVSTDEKRELHRLLLGSGMAISEVNTVRKHVSAFKGGRLAAAVAPARLINLTVSDVAGNALDVLSDPSVPDRSSAAQAIATLRRHGLWDAVPASVRDHLNSPGADPDLGGMEIHSTLLVTGETACEAMAIEAAGLGAKPIVLSTTLEDEAASIGRALAARAIERAGAGPKVLIGCGGEGTVHLGHEGEFGLGGPNQEAALAAAEGLSGEDVAAVFLDTDGSDGGTTLSGAVSDGTTAERARAAGIDLASVLARHRSGDAVRTLGDGIDTGPTHTNVNDLFVVAVGESPVQAA